MVCALRFEHPLAEALSSLFAAERQQADHVMGAIRLAAVSIQPLPLTVWLYGCLARGDDHATSGVDIALVSALPEKLAQAEAMRIAISAALHEMDREVSVVTLAPADVSRLAAERSELWDEFLQGAVVLVGLDAPTMMEQLTVVAPSPAQ
jgi:predicted nucleotidyltransferase